ncbi:hypothetical protein BJV82DRAFT_600803 [Fennellomyces sp. T-0311]|nr:hypothetical protein BJV82DRAFT_600803 [Fennellomyces sp. T-0311]
MAGDSSGHPTEWYSGFQTLFNCSYTPQKQLWVMLDPLENTPHQFPLPSFSSSHPPICTNTLSSWSPLGDTQIRHNSSCNNCLYFHTTTSSTITAHDSCSPFLPDPTSLNPSDYSYTQSSTNLTCTICNRTFTRPQDLRRHLQTAKEHARHRPFLCEFCGRSYSRADALTRHKKTTKSCRSQT